MFPAGMEIVIIGSDREVFPSGEGRFAFVFLQCGRCSGLQTKARTKTPLLPGEMNSEDSRGFDSEHNPELIAWMGGVSIVVTTYFSRNYL